MGRNWPKSRDNAALREVDELAAALGPADLIGNGRPTKRETERIGHGKGGRKTNGRAPTGVAELESFLFEKGEENGQKCKSPILLSHFAIVPIQKKCQSSGRNTSGLMKLDEERFLMNSMHFAGPLQNCPVKF